MSMIFPGMDPYLEDPAYWKGVHTRLIVYLADQLSPLIEPRFVASIEERVYVEAPEPRSIWPDALVMRRVPDLGEERGEVAVMEAVEVEEPVLVRSVEDQVSQPYIALIEPKSDERVVAIIEVVSPSNKSSGPGRESYLAKQAAVLGSDAHLIEIDLLRQGPHVVAVPASRAKGDGSARYLVSVNRARGDRSEFETYPKGLRDRLPRFALPLADGARDVPVDLQAALAQTYEAGRYRKRLRYDRPCVPPLSPDDQAWADGLIRPAFGA